MKQYGSIDPVENSVVATLGNIHGQESNTRILLYLDIKNAFSRVL